MITAVHESPEIYLLSIPLPENPLRGLNCYVVKTGAKPLVIDTGFNRPECREALLNGLAELGINPGDCVLFLTHFHADHCGLAEIFEDAGAEIRMGLIDWNLMQKRIDPGGWNELEQLFMHNGFPEDEVQKQNANHARRYAARRVVQATLMTDNESFQLGSICFQCIWTPGHTPGHMCLYLPDQRILFSGDHILYTITPNISVYEGIADSLSDYLLSLDKIAKLDVIQAFPAHREIGDFYQRILELKRHHRERLAEVLALAQQTPGQTSYEIAQKMKWSVHNKTWEELPPNQKWFATGEAIAHLDHLKAQGSL